MDIGSRRHDRDRATVHGHELMDRLLPDGLPCGSAWYAVRAIEGTPIRRGDLVLFDSLPFMRKPWRTRGHREGVDRPTFGAVLDAIDEALVYIADTLNRGEATSRKDLVYTIRRIYRRARTTGVWSKTRPSPLIVIHNPCSAPIVAPSDAAAIDVLLRETQDGARW